MSSFAPDNGSRSLRARIVFVERALVGIAVVALVAGCVLTTGCAGDSQVIGSPPLGERRNPDDDPGGATSDPGDGSTRDAGAGEAIDPARQVAGVISTNVYHRGDCPRLEGVDRSDRVRFVSPYDGLDGGYDPCPTCNPGP